MTALVDHFLLAEAKMKNTKMPAMPAFPAPPGKTPTGRDCLAANTAQVKSDESLFPASTEAPLPDFCV
jgi:hypothetical protein